jgi:hypothetical protein
MNAKLTLTLEKEVIEIAKEYAKEKGQSLSEMVENYFRFVAVNKKSANQKQLSANVNKLRGIIKTDNDFNYKDVLTQELLKKHDL